MMVTQPANCRARQLARRGTTPATDSRRQGALLMVACAACWGFQAMGHTTAAGHSRHRVPAWQRLLLMEARAACLGAARPAGQNLSA